MLIKIIGLSAYDKSLKADGGPGSGNFGHEGRPGKVGGSAGSSSESPNCSKVSAIGANKFEKGFSEKNLDAHWNGSKTMHSHKKQYPNMTKEQYGKRALELIQKPVGEKVDGYKNKRSQVVRYDVETNDYVKGSPDLGIATMFKPSRGIEYFKEWKEKEGVNDEE